MIETHSLSFFLLYPRMPPVNSDSSLRAIFLTLVWRQSLQRSTHRHQPLAMLHAAISSSALEAQRCSVLCTTRVHASVSLVPVAVGCDCAASARPVRHCARRRGATRALPVCFASRWHAARPGRPDAPFPNPMPLPPTSGGRPRARCRTPSTPFPLASLIV